MRAGKGVVLEISRVTNPSHSGSRGVTFVMMPQRAYVDFPTVTVRMFRGILKYSTDRARANELGGTMQTSRSYSTKDFGSKALGSSVESRGLAERRSCRNWTSVPYIGDIRPRGRPSNSS